MIQATSFLEPLQLRGFSFYSGVPCSFLKPFINSVINSSRLDYVGATSEGEAAGITLGAYLAGRNTVTMCQNSGLGNVVNPLTSLNFPFRIPTLLITTWRGEPGLQDEPQHNLMGQITHQLLDTLRIPWIPFPESDDEIEEAIREADSYMTERQLPFALVLRKGAITSSKLGAKPVPNKADIHKQIRAFGLGSERPTRTQAIKQILENTADADAIIATTGKTGRELFTLDDRHGNLYVVGGMGTAAPIGLGISLCQPKQRTIILDGDGAALMKLGALATIGHYQPEKFLHIILDNESHDSTGGQATASSTTHFAHIAAAANYRNVYTAESLEEINACFKDEKRHNGPSLLHLKIKSGSPEKLGRPTVKPHQVKERFMDFLKAQSTST